MSRLQDIQRKVEDTLEEALKPINEPVTTSTKQVSSPKRDKFTEIPLTDDVAPTVGPPTQEDIQSNEIIPVQDSPKDIIAEVSNPQPSSELNQQIKFLTDSNTSLLSEGHKLSRRLGVVESKWKEGQQALEVLRRDLEIAKSDSLSLRTQLEKSRADSEKFRAERDRAVKDLEIVKSEQPFSPTAQNSESKEILESTDTTNFGFRLLQANIDRLELERDEAVRANKTLLFENQKIRDEIIELVSGNSWMEKNSQIVKNLEISTPFQDSAFTTTLEVENSNLKEQIASCQLHWEDDRRNFQVEAERLKCELDQMRHKIQASESLRKAAEEDRRSSRGSLSGFDRLFEANAEIPTVWRVPDTSEELSRKFELSLQTIGRLQDELEDSQETVSVLKQELRQRWQIDR